MARRFLTPAELTTIKFNQSSDATMQKGELIYDSEHEALMFGLSNNAKLELGQQTVILVYNDTVTNIPAGRAVYGVGVQNERPSVIQSTSASMEQSSRTFGVTAEVIPAGGSGWVSTAGLLGGIDTSAFVSGEELWLSPTVPGALITTKTGSPNHDLLVGYCVVSSPTNGVIYLSFNRGVDTESIHDIVLTGLASGDILRYNSANGYWENEPLSSLGGGATVSETPPTTPSPGDFWFNSATAETFIYYDSTWVEVGEGGGSVGIIEPVAGLDFDTVNAEASAIGRLVWDDGEGTLSLGLKGGNVNLQIGQENVALCYNGTGSTLTDGQVVYISGAQGQRPRISLAQANSEAASSKVLGVVTEPILNGAEGFVATFGIVNGLDTSAFTAGQTLYLSPTVAGALTATKPVAPNHMVFVAYAVSIHASSGRIFVNPHNGYELDEIHDVLISGKVDRDVLIYDSVSGLWKNEPLNLTTDTVGNYVASVSTSDGISGGAVGSEGTVIALTNTDKGSSQNIFKNVAVSGQTDIVADSNNDTLTFAGGTGITLTTNATTDTVTVTNSDLGSSQNIFKNITDGTNTSAADTNNDTFTLTASTGIGIVVNATTDTATFTNSGVTSFTAGTTGLTPSTATTGAVTLAGTLIAANGGTGQSSYAVGDILYASTTTALSKLADVATGNSLISGGVGVAPSWGKIGLTTHISGTLAVGNGGTGLATTPTNGQILIGNGTNYTLAAITQGTGITVTNGSGTISIANAGVTGLTGTANEVEVSASTGSVTVGLPNDVTIGNNLTVTGTLTVNGTTTTVNSTTLSVDDPIITLGGDVAPIADDNKDRGIEFRYFDTVARIGFMGYDDSAGTFVFLTAATNTSEVFSGTKGTIDANGVTQAVDNNTTLLATTAFVVGQAGAANPLVNNTVSVGTSLRYSRQDHVHPIDTSRAPTASPTFTGTITTPLTPAGYVTNTVGGVLGSVATIPNAGLTNSSVTIGSTAVSLGATVTTFVGLVSVTSTTFVGALTGNASSATNATNTGITEDVATAVAVYPTWVTANTGNLPQKTTSTRLSFVPSTGILTATQFSGSGAGLTSIPNSALTNSSVTIGSTAVSLGATVTTFAGLASVTSTTFVGALTGNASSATSATNATNTGITEDVATAVAVYPTWVTANTGNLPQKTTSTRLSFVPSTGILTATGFSGSGASLTGIPQSAVTNLTTDLSNKAATNQTFFLGTTSIAINRTSAAIALTGITSIDGSAASATNATNSTNVGITNDTTTNATMFPLWVTANTGNLPAKVTSTKLSFNPSTGILTSTQFTGSGAGLTSIPNGALTNSSVTVNGTAIALGASGTVTAAAGTLTGATLNATVTGSSLTSVGTITSGIWNAGSVTSSGGISGTTGTFSGAVRVDHYSANPNGPQVSLVKYRGDSGSPAVVSSGDSLGANGYFGFDGTSNIEAARIEAWVDGTPGASDMPGRLSFFTTPDGSGTPVERMRIGSDGRVTFGATPPASHNPRITIQGNQDEAALTISAVTAGSNVLTVNTISSGTLAVGQIVSVNASNTPYFPPGTYIQSFGTGTGGTGTYNLSAPSVTTSASINVFSFNPANVPILRMHSLDPDVRTGQQIGGIQFWSDDGTGNANGVRSSIFATEETGLGASRLQFSVAPDAGPQAVRMILNSAGLLSAPAGTSLGPWIAYTPSIIGTGWAIGNGTITGSYNQIGKVVHFRIAITWGSTSTFGTGQLGIGTVPHGGVLASTPSANSNVIDVVGYDTSAASYYQLAGRWGSSANFNLFTIGTGGVMANVINTAPFTWANGDFIFLAGCYEAA